MNKLQNSVLLVFLAITIAGCSRGVKRDDVYGTYMASYPFGTETITLKRDGSFVQRVTIENQQPATVQGTWQFDQKESRLTLSGSMVIVDGFDRLRNDWRAIDPGVVSVDVERHWSKVLMASAAKYPYVKQ